jgi:hypothetical protein
LTVRARTLKTQVSTARSWQRTIPCAKDHGRLLVTEFLELDEWPGVWALGDCAAVPDPRTGGFHAPTAQHALRQAKVLAHNVVATMRGTRKIPFHYSTFAQLAAIGRRTGVARILGINFSGFPAWWLWRTVYLCKLPRLEKKLRVAFDWTLDLIFSKDLVQFQEIRAGELRQIHASSGIVAHQEVGYGVKRRKRQMSPSRADVGSPSGVESCLMKTVGSGLCKGFRILTTRFGHLKM